MRDAARQAGVAEAYLPVQTPELARAGKALLEPWEQKITSMVRDRISLLRAKDLLAPGRRQLAVTYSTDMLEVDDRARLLVECQVDDATRFDQSYFESIGGTLVERALRDGFVKAWVPAEQFETLARRSDVRRISHVDLTFPDLGAILTQGDAVHNADDVRTMFSLNGTGQTVGVISTGVANLATAQGSNDLPNNVNVPAGCAGTLDEGTAMLEIVADLAPGAGLAYCTGNGGTTSMLNAIDSMMAVPGITVITDDIANAQEPLFEDGPIAKKKQAAVAAGIFYTSSAGNRGNQHYQGNFNSTAANVTIGPNTYDHPHDFGGGDRRLSITLQNGANDLFLQWAEPFGAAAIDLDLFVIDNAGNILASSTNLQNGDDNPQETITVNVGAATQAHIVVDYVGAGPVPTVFFDLRSFTVRWNEFLVKAGSINGASRQPEVYATGAANYTTPGQVNSFSSRGPVQRFFPGPTITRQKPDGVCVDSVSTTGAGCFGFCGPTCPPLPAAGCNFGGTSAATPHAAGIAALVLQACPILTPAQLTDLLNVSAVDIDAAGPDNNAGFGRLDALAAICALPPKLTCPADITVECSQSGGTPKTDPAIQAFLNAATATDFCTPNVTVTNNAPAVFQLGTTVVTFSSTDAAGHTGTCQASVKVADTTPPAITVSVNRTALWPPNHKLVDIQATVTVLDVCDPNAAFVLSSVTSNEPENGLGDGDTAPDIVGATLDTPDLAFQLRSERSGNLNGRKYTIIYCATDASGNTACDTATVTVAHDQAGIASAGTGFDPAGTNLLDGAQSLTLIALSSNEDVEVVNADEPALSTVTSGEPAPTKLAIDATHIDPAQAYVGNQAGVVVPTRSVVADFNHDGLLDRAFFYPAAPVRDLLARNPLEFGSIGMHYVVEGTNYLVPDIFQLGSVALFPSQVEIPDREPVGDARGLRPTTEGPSSTVRVPTVTRVAAAYPNPFNRATSIWVDLAMPGHLTVAVYDSRGQRVRTLVAESREAGRYQVEWNGRNDDGKDVARGIYFVTLDTATAHDRKKLVLLN